MRIVNGDNYDGHFPDESFLFGRMSKEAAEEISDVINKYFSGTHEPRYWKVVDDDYMIVSFEP